MNFRNTVGFGSFSFTRGLGIRILPERVVRTDAALGPALSYEKGKSAAQWGGSGDFHITATRIPTSFGGLHAVLAEGNIRRPFIVYCGGSGFREEQAGGPLLRALIHFGDVLFFNYPGYGHSAGSGSKADFAETVTAVQHFAEAQAGRRGSRLIIWGHSFGGGVAAALAARAQPVLALVLEGTFGSLNDMVKHPLGPLAPLVHAEPDEAVVQYIIPEVLAKFAAPIIAVASRADRVVPFAVTRKLASDLTRTGHHVTFIPLRHAPHVGLFNDPDHRPAVQKAITEAAKA
jgi:pimeloyl-ACP methyl ester carboxylesterase